MQKERKAYVENAAGARGTQQEEMELDDAGCDVGGLSDYDDEYCGCTVCAQCSYRFVKGDDVLKIRITGDIIHKDCFIDYADDNMDMLSYSVVLSA